MFIDTSKEERKVAEGEMMSTYIISELIVISDSEVSQFTKVYVTSSNCIQYEDIRRETQRAPYSTKRAIIKRSRNKLSNKFCGTLRFAEN